MDANVFLIGPSALWLYRRDAGRMVLKARPTDCVDASSSVNGYGEMSRVMSGESDHLQRLLRDMPRPVHLLVPDAGHRSRAGCISEHVRSGSLLPGSFLRLGRNVMVASPMTLLLFMAQRLDFVELAMLGSEMCGLFAYDRGSEDGFVNRPQLLKTSEIVDTCRSTENVYGIRRLRKAAPWIFDRARSPMEAELALRLSLPPSRGGYSTPRPELNHQVTLSSRAARIAGKRHVELDLFYAAEESDEKGLDVEYYGEKSHIRQFGADMRRRDALLDSGYDVVELFKEHVSGAYTFDTVARMICKKLGMRPPKKSAEAMAKRKALHDELVRIRWQGEAGSTR